MAAICADPAYRWKSSLGNAGIGWMRAGSATARWQEPDFCELALSKAPLCTRRFFYSNLPFMQAVKPWF
jgi:hypothetical protein